MDAWLSTLLHLIAGFGAWRFLIAFAGMFFETSILIGLLIPGDTIVLLTSTSVRGVADYLLLLVAVIAGAAAGESVGFLLGRFFGPRLRHSRLGRRIGERHWLRAELQLRHRGGITVFLSRFLPFLHALVPVTVGMSEMRYRRFMAWTLPACLVWAVIYVSVGTIAGKSYLALSSQLNTASWVFFGILVVFVVLVIASKRLLGRITHRHPSARVGRR